MNSHFKEQHKKVLPGVSIWNNFLSQEELKPIIEEINTFSWENDVRIVNGAKSFTKYKQRILDSLNMPNCELMNLDAVLLKKRYKVL